MLRALMSVFNRFHDRWENLHPLWRVAGVLVVLAGLAIGASGPGLELYRGWKNDRNLAGAKEALMHGNYSEARELSLQVLRADASRHEALAVLLPAANALGDPRSAEFALGMLGQKESAASDRTLAWEIVCRSCSAGYVFGVWPALPEPERANPDFVALLFDRMLREGLEDDAALLLRQQPQPLLPQLHLRYMQLFIHKGTGEAYREFQRTLNAHLAAGRGNMEPEVALIDQLPQSSLLADTFAALSQWQKKQGKADAASELRLARCEMASAPGRADDIFSAALARYRDSDPIATASWCLRTGRPDAVPALLDSPAAAGNEELFELRCRLNEKTGYLKEWAALLDQPPASAFLPVVFCDRAYVASRVTDEDARKKAEDEALRSASESLANDAFIRLARRATSRGLDDLALRAWVEAIRRRSGPLPLANDIKHVIEQLAIAKKESELLEVLTSYRLVEPGNPMIFVQYDYLACLNGTIDPDALIDDLTPIHKKFPDALPVRCVLALAHLIEGRGKEALRLTDGDEIDWFAAGAAHRAIRGIILRENGRDEEAAVFLEDFPWDALLPAEKRTLAALTESPVGAAAR